MNTQAQKSPFEDFSARLSALVDHVFEGNQRALALNARVSPQAVHTYINKNRIPKSEELYRISRALAVTMEYLLTGERGESGLVMESAPMPDVSGVMRQLKAAREALAAAEAELKKFAR